MVGHDIANAVSISFSGSIYTGGGGLGALGLPNTADIIFVHTASTLVGTNQNLRNAINSCSLLSTYTSKIGAISASLSGSEMILHSKNPTGSDGNSYIFQSHSFNQGIAAPSTTSLFGGGIGIGNVENPLRHGPSESVFFQLTDALATTVRFHCTTGSVAHTQATYPTISFHGSATESAITMASVSVARINQGILLGYTASGNTFPLLISASAKEINTHATYGAYMFFSQSVAGTGGNVLNGKRVGKDGNTYGTNNTFQLTGNNNFYGGTGPHNPSAHYTSSYVILTTRGPEFAGPSYDISTESYERHVFYWYSASNVHPQLGGYTTHSTTAINLGAPSFHNSSHSVSGSYDSFAIASRSLATIDAHVSFSSITNLNATWDQAYARHYWRLWDTNPDNAQGANFENIVTVTAVNHGNPPAAISGGLNSQNQFLVNTAAGGAVLSSGTASVSTIDGNRGIPGQILARRHDGKNLFEVSSSTMATESWNHVVYQKSGSHLQLYVNNVLECGITASDEGRCRNKDDIYFGVATRPTWSGEYEKEKDGTYYLNPRTQKPRRKMVREFMRPMSGALDEIRIYNRALTDEEITYHYRLPNGTPFVGNVFYEHGLLTITHPSSAYQSIASECTLSYKNTYTITENEYILDIKRGEYNFTMNPSIIEKSATGSRESKVATFVTDTEWDPYITTIGLYDTQARLLAVGKLSKPLRKDDGYDTTLVVRFDT